MSFNVAHQCPNCRRLSDKPFIKSLGFCSDKCQSEYDKRAYAVGGYHVLARDETIRDLRAEIASLKRRIADYEAGRKTTSRAI